MFLSFFFLSLIDFFLSELFLLTFFSIIMYCSCIVLVMNSFANNIFFSSSAMSTKESKPNLNHSQVMEIIKRLYGLTVSIIRSLPGYDDQNFYVAPSEGGEYVLKVMNSVDSHNITVIELQTHSMNFLHQRGLPAQIALPTLTGQLMSVEEFGESVPVIY